MSQIWSKNINVLWWRKGMLVRLDAIINLLSLLGSGR